MMTSIHQEEKRMDNRIIDSQENFKETNLPKSHVYINLLCGDLK